MRRALPLLLVALAACAPEPVREGRDVRLVDPGAEPRRLLRLEGAPGLRQALRYSLASRQSAAVTGREPAAWETRDLLLDLSATVLRRDPNGAMHVEVAFERSGETSSEPGDSGEKPGWVPRDLSGTRARLLVSPRGGILEGRLPASQVPILLLVDLPEEPVGVGARWQIHSHPGAAGLEFDETTTFTLASLDGLRAEIGIEIEQTLAEPATARGGRLEVLTWKGRAEGRIRLRLDAALIDAARIEWRMTTDHLLHQGGESVGVTTSVECDVKVAPR